MSEEMEFSISALRRKRSESGDTGSQQSQTTSADRDGYAQEQDGPREESTWAYTRRREDPRSKYIAEEDPYRRSLPYQGEAASEEELSFKMPFDLIRILDVLKQKWKWWVSAGLVLGIAGFFIGFPKSIYTVGLQLMRREIPVAFRATEGGDTFKPQFFTETTLLDLLKSPEVSRRAASNASPPISSTVFSSGISADHEVGAELINVFLSTSMAPQRGVELLNLYANEVVKFTQEMQSREAKEVTSYIGDKVASVEREMAEVTKAMNKFPAEEKFASPDKQTETYVAQLTDLDLKIQAAEIELDTTDLKLVAMQRELDVRNPLADKLQAAKDNLQNLLSKYTEQHPLVQDQETAIKALEEQFKAYKADPSKRYNGSPTSDGIYVQIVQMEAQKKALVRQIQELSVRQEKLQKQFHKTSETNLDYINLKSRYDSLFTMHTMLAGRQREAQLFVDNPTGYCRIFTPASIDRVWKKSSYKKSLIFMLAGLVAGMVGMMGFLAAREVIDDRLRSAVDVERATGLPVLGSLGDLDKMTPAEQADWAFRTWTIIKGKLSVDQNDGLVCGVISARHGEGRSTWIELLSATANSRGLRVLTVETRRTEEPKVHPHENSQNGKGDKTDALMASVLSHPLQIAERLASSGPNQIVHIPLPGWVWNLERRKQWQTAMDHWGRIENLILLVELPPASEPESILLAEKLPQLIWLTESGKVTAKETRKHMETLRHANCNLVGAVVNREPTSFFRNLISRWFCIGAISFGVAFSASAQKNRIYTTDTTPRSPTPATVQAEPQPRIVHEIVATNASIPTNPLLVPKGFSANDPKHRANWQKDLTLGPGDVVNLSFFGETNLTKNDVIIGPDGRVSYMQATVRATGLTIDELRDKFNEELTRFYRVPRVMITPVAFHSKKFFMLGKVMNRGVYSLDRPITVVEALGLAHGFETAMVDRNSIDLVDLPRSFLIRDGKRMPLDFEKLFYGADMSQNIPVEPNDYFYFPPADLKEVYVLGQVNAPGTVPYVRDLSVLAAIAQRSGFAQASFKSRVLIIRGSLNRPQTFVVDTLGMTDGRKIDFKLEPKDIIYVNKRPFIRAEELLDIAITGFIQSAAASWAGTYIGPFITAPIIHGF